MALPQGAAKIAIRKEVWDDWKDAPIMWAVKEQVDNCFNKAERALPWEAVPWNAHNIKMHLGVLDSPGVQPRHVLILSDDGRGLTHEEFVEGFFGIGHTSANKPQNMQSNSISVFGTGSKTADACLASGVLYFTTHTKANYTVIARTGKDLSEVKDDPDLLISDVCVPHSIRTSRQADPHTFNSAWEFTRYLTALNSPDMSIVMDKMATITEGRFNSPFDAPGDGRGLDRALTFCEQHLPLGSTGFVRMLSLRPEKLLRVGHEGKGLRYHVPGRDGMSIEMKVVELLEANYLFPPAEPSQQGASAAPQGLVLDAEGPASDAAAGAAASEDNTAGGGGSQQGPAGGGSAQLSETELLALQQELVQQLQAPNYYLHPVTQQLYCPRVTVHGHAVNWGNNPLLRNLRYKRSPVLEVAPDTDKYGDSHGEPPARVLVQYLGDTMEERHKATRDSGVAVYVGCRRVCDPELGRGNWAMAGVADELMDFATSVSPMPLPGSSSIMPGQ